MRPTRTLGSGTSADERSVAESDATIVDKAPRALDDRRSAGTDTEGEILQPPPERGRSLPSAFSGRPRDFLMAPYPRITTTSGLLDDSAVTTAATTAVRSHAAVTAPRSAQFSAIYPRRNARSSIGDMAGRAGLVMLPFSMARGSAGSWRCVALLVCTATCNDNDVIILG